MAWRRHNARPLIVPVVEPAPNSPLDQAFDSKFELDPRSEPANVIDLRTDSIATVARAAGEDPDRLIREVRAFRAALPARHAVAAAVDSVAASAFALRDPEARLTTAVFSDGPFDLDEHDTDTRVRRPRRRTLTAAAGLLVIALISGTTVAAVAGHDGAGGQNRLQALEFHAAQQYGVLALAVQDRSPGQIVAASVALHASLLPLMQEAQTDQHAAKTALLLLTNERALLMSTQTQDASIVSALHETQTLLTQLQNTTKAPLPVVVLPTVVLPPTDPSPSAPAPTVPVTAPTAAPTAPPTTAPTTPPPATPTPEPPPVTPTPETSPSSILVPQVTPSASAASTPDN